MYLSRCLFCCLCRLCSSAYKMSYSAYVRLSYAHELQGIMILCTWFCGLRALWRSLTSLQYLSYKVRKHSFWHVRSKRTHISRRTNAVRSETSLSAWRNLASLAIQNAPSEDSDQTARMRRLIWIFTKRTSEGTFSDVASHLIILVVFLVLAYIFHPCL